MRRIIYITAVFILFAGSWNCKDEYTICNLSKEVNFIAGFYRHVGASDVPVSAPSLTISVLNNTGTIYSSQPNAASFALPLNPLTDSAKYLIRVSSSLPQDTLTVIYTSQTSNLSAECGSIVFNNITALRSTLHTIDSVKIIVPVINNTPVQNARIYF